MGVSAAKKPRRVLRRGDPPGDREYLSDALPARLRRARLELAVSRGKEVSPAALGHEIGVAGYTIARYEDGGSEPNLKMLEALAAVLGVTPEWLAFGVMAESQDLLGTPPPGFERAPLLPLRPARTRAELEAERRKTERKHG